MTAAFLVVVLSTAWMVVVLVWRAWWDSMVDHPDNE